MCCWVFWGVCCDFFLLVWWRFGGFCVGLFLVWWCCLDFWVGMGWVLFCVCWLCRVVVWCWVVWLFFGNWSCCWLCWLSWGLMRDCKWFCCWCRWLYNCWKLWCFWWILVLVVFFLLLVVWFVDRFGVIVLGSCWVNWLLVLLFWCVGRKMCVWVFLWCLWVLCLDGVVLLYWLCLIVVLWVLL